MCGLIQLVMMILAMIRGWWKEALVMFGVGMVLVALFPEGLDDPTGVFLMGGWALVWIAFLVYAMIKPKQKGASFFRATAAAALDLHSFPPAEASVARPTKNCPFCAEAILAEAIVCRYCGRDLPSTRSVPPNRLDWPSSSMPAVKSTRPRRIHGIPTPKRPKPPQSTAHPVQSKPHGSPGPTQARIRELIDMLNSDEAYKRKEAAQELGNIEFSLRSRQQPKVIAALQRLAASDPNPDVKTAAALALQSLQ